MYGLHRGYSFQDLLAAVIISENLHKEDFEISVEYKEGGKDSFDDIVYIADKQKIKLQVKHTSIKKVLIEEDFFTSGGELDLKTLSHTFSRTDNTLYVLATNRIINNTLFFLPNSKKATLSFSSAYSLNTKKLSSQFLKRFVIEHLPDASLSLYTPGNLEKILLESLRINIGIGEYPNNQTSVRDVAGRLILFANELRGSVKPALISRIEIFRYIGLNIEYGHISQNFPFTSTEYRLYRKQIVSDLQASVLMNKYTILEGLPGSGKSHIFDDLASSLSKDDYLVVKHYCYLEPTDSQAFYRILSDTMYGNFLHQLEHLQPEIAKINKPYFSATRATLQKFLEKIAETGKRVIVMVDGLDHLNRVVSQNRLSPEIIDNFVSNLMDITLPEGTSIFIASQPSNEITEIAKSKKATIYTLPAWNEQLVGEYAQMHNNLLTTEKKFILNTNVIKQLTEKTEGNPLYLTYVLKEIINVNKKVDVIQYIQGLPKLHKDLNNYYLYLIRDLPSNEYAVIQTLALLDFSVSVNELLQMFPPILSPGIRRTLSKIKSILKPGLVQSGIRIYHESFRRFIIERAYKQKLNCKELYEHIIDWLDHQGFYASQRAYRYLVSYLIKAKENTKILSLFAEDYIAKSLFHFHPEENIKENLNKIAVYFAWQGRWDIYCRAVELSRALHTYSAERSDSVHKQYCEAILKVHGPEIFCERLLFDGKPVFTNSTGVILCQLAEHSGNNPPWKYYDVTGEKMHIKTDEEISQFHKIGAAHFLRTVRHSNYKDALLTLQEQLTRHNFPGSEKKQIKLLLKEFDLLFGVSKYYRSLLKLKLTEKKAVVLKAFIAQYLFKIGNQPAAVSICNKLLRKTIDPDVTLICLECKADVHLVKFPDNFVKLTKEILLFRNLYNKEVPVFNDWYQSSLICSYTSPNSIKVAQKLITYIDGWYRAWIAFLLELSLLETAKMSVSRKASLLEDALNRLSIHSYPFAGSPRAVDLFSIRGLCVDSFRRTLFLAKDFHNFNKIIKIVCRISDLTTSYLQGSSGGPLSGEDLNSLIQEIYTQLSKQQQKETLELLKKNIEKGLGTSIFYDSEATEYLKLAVIYAESNMLSKAKEYLMNSCIRLAAYGFRKDITVFELIDPIKYLSKSQLKTAVQWLEKTFPFTYIVTMHTDGKETLYALKTWLDVLIATNDRVAIQTIIEITKKTKSNDWRIESAIEILCDKLITSGSNPVIIAELYKTICFDDPEMDVSGGLKIAGILIGAKEKTAAKVLFDSICSSLHSTAVRSYVSRKDNYEKVLKFAAQQGLTISTYYLKKFEIEHTKSQPSQDNESRSILNTEQPKDFISKRIQFSSLSLAQLDVLVNENSKNDVLNNVNIKKFAKVLSKFYKNQPEAVKDLLLNFVRRNLYLRESVELLVRLRDEILKNKCTVLAAFVSMLGFIYAKGAGGWYSLADNEFNFLAIDAFSLSKREANRTLSSEMSYLFTNSSYYIGPTRHLINLFIRMGKIAHVKKIWDEAYLVIKYRLPSSVQENKIIKQRTPSFKFDKSAKLEYLLDALIKLRKNNFFPP